VAAVARVAAIRPIPEEPIVRDRHQVNPLNLPGLTLMFPYIYQPDPNRRTGVCLVYTGVPSDNPDDDEDLGVIGVVTGAMQFESDLGVVFVYGPAFESRTKPSDIFLRDVVDRELPDSGCFVYDSQGRIMAIAVYPGIPWPSLKMELYETHQELLPRVALPTKP
jgi:hypothetical protein